MHSTRWLWRLLLLGLVVVPLAFAADVKISALPAASSAASTDELPANQSGTTRKVTVAQLGTALNALVRVTGSSAAAGDAETWQVLTSACADNTSTTPAVCMTTTGLAAGTWVFEYRVVWQSASTTVGINFQVNATGTVTRVRANRMTATTGTTAATGVADGVSATLTGQLWESDATRSDSGSLGPNTGVDTANADQLDYIQGILVTSTSGNLELLAATETAATAIRVSADTTLILRRVN